MSAIAVSQDGAAIFLALEDGSGNSVVVKCERDDLTTFTAVYAPGAGTACNVLATGDPDLMLFYGNFGSGIQVVKHVISTGAETNISPSGLTTKVINALAVNPSNISEIWATVNTDQDLLGTVDGGTTWTTLNAALGINPTSLLVFWAGDYNDNRAFIGGTVTGVTELLYTPNEGASYSDYAGASLDGAAAIVGIEGKSDPT